MGGIGVLEKVSDHPWHLHFSAGNLEARCDEAGAVYVTDPLDSTHDRYLPYLARTGLDLQRDKLQSLSERVKRPPQEQGRAGGGNRGKRRIRELVILLDESWMLPCS